MNISETFKKVISDTFYDKEVDIYDISEETGEELDVVRKKGNIIENSLECNVHQTSNDIVLKDYGLNIEASIMITCDNTIAEIGDILTYKEQDYIITGRLNLDSHIKLFAKLGGIDG